MKTDLRHRPLADNHLEQADPVRVVGEARRWIGTPYARGASLRGVGCDCVGLARGVWAEVTGAEPPPAPRWSPDWAAIWPRRLAELRRRIMIERPPALAGPGDLIVLRRTDGGAAHMGILAAPGRIIHATEAFGVVEVPLGDWSGRIVAAAAFPAAPL